MEICFVVEKIELASGIFEIVFSPSDNKNFPIKFLVATPSIVIANTKKHKATKNKIESDTTFGSWSKSINLAGHKSSKTILGFIAFIESFIFPIPPDVLIIPMTIAKRQEWLRILRNFL